MHPSPDSADSPLGDEIAERVASLATWVVEIDARLHAAELRTGDEKTAKELRRAIEALAKHDPKLESRLTNRVDVLADRLATLASTVSTTAAAVAGKEGEIAGLKRELGEDAERIQSLARELGRTADAAEVEEIRVALQALSTERPRRTGDQRVEELGAKVDYVSERLDTLAKTVATTASGLARRDGDVAVLRQRLEESSTQVGQALAELRQLHEESALAERLRSLESALAQTTTDLRGRTRDIAALRARIDEAYARVGSVVTDLQRSVGSLSSRVATVEQLPALTELALEHHSANVHPKEDEIARLCALVDDLRMRLAANEQALAAVIGSRDVNARLDDLSLRVSMERLDPLIAIATGSGPAAGDGRFRLELRALELRMEQAEAAARENREAVLVQLERLASRIDWRLQRLESQEAKPFAEAAGGVAQVVPIRGADV